MNSYSVVRPLPVHTIITPTTRAMRLLKKAAFFVALCGVAPGAWGQLYWDSNGFDLGAGTTPTGIWGTDSFWNSVFDGTAAPGAWTPGELAVFSAGTDAAGPYTVTVTGTQTGTGVTLEEGDLTLSGGTLTLTGGAALSVASGQTLTMNSILAGSVGWTKSGAGTLVFTTSSTATGSRNIVDGIVSINSSARIPGSGDVTLNGGTLRQTNPLSAGSFIPAGTALVIGPNGGTVNYTCPGAAFPANSNSIYSGTITGPGNTLTKTGPSEFRYQGAGLPNTTYAKLVVNEGLFRLGFNTSADERGFGAVPSVPTADAITLNGGAIGGSFIVTNHPNRGITLGLAGGSINTSGGEMIVAANITGPGGLAKNTTGNLTLLGQNDFAGDFTINNGGVRFNSDAAAGAGTVVVTPTGTVTLRNLSPTLTSTLTNPITLNANGGFDIDLTAASGNTFTMSGPISGAGYMTRGRATGAGGVVVLSGDNSGWSGGLYLHRGVIGLGHKNALGSAPFSITPPTNATPDFVTVQATVPLTGANAVANLVIVNTNVTLGGVNDLEVSGSVYLSNVTRTITVTNNSIFSGVVSGDAGAGLAKAGAGTLTLAAANNYSGDTLVSGGTLRVANVTGSATGAGLVTVEPGATLTGPGSVAGTLTVNGTISPGASPGTQNTGSEVWSGGGSYLWEINDVDTGQGSDPGWDMINITGGLTINATSGSKFNINISSLTLANAAGVVHDFNDTVEYSWTILKTTTGISGFNAGAFNLDVSGMANNLGNGAFAIELANEGKDLVLHFIDRIQITGQPMNITATQGDMASLSVTATGFMPTYQWRKEGIDLLTETLSTLTFVSIQPSQAGNYDVVVSNAGGSLTSTVATVTVLFAPAISVQPQSQTVFAGSNATFSVTATGNPAPDYRWYRNAVELIGENASTLTINNAQPANEGSYTVNVSNSVNNVTSTAATLSLFRDFSDAADPTYPTLLANNGARHLIAPALHLGTNVDAEVDGQPDSTATLDDTTGAPDDEDGVTFLSALAPGQTVNVEVVASAAGLLDAWIDFNADGDWADANEQVFTNVVVAAGTNTLAIAVPVDAVLGTTVSRFRLSIAGGLSYTGEALDGEVEDHAVAIAAQADLALAKTGSPDPVATSSNLTFTITVTNIGPAGATGVTVTDTLPAGVTFSSALASQGGCGEVAGVVTCSLGALGVNGSATVTIVVVPTASGSVSNYAAVAAVEVDPNLANNSASTETTVQDPPVITVQPVGGTAECGGTFMFSVTATGSAPLAYQWKHAGTNLPGATASTLTVTATAETAGAYAVDVANQVGATTSDTVMLAVMDTTPPMITCPANIIACTISNSAVVIFSATAIDSCDNAPTVACTPASGSDFAVGITVVTCEAYDASGNTNTCAFSVTVNQNTTVTGLASTTVCPGTSVTFGPVTPGGTGPFAFQWTKDGVVIDGATSASYVIASAMAGDAGTYCVIATGACNSATNCATLMLHPEPTVAVNSPTICAGDTMTLTATTDASDPAYLWSPGGEMTASIMVSPTSTTIYTVTVTDGTTTCSKSGSGTVTVADPVVFANSSPITINDNSTGSPYPSTISVSGLTTLICKLTVSVSGLSHTWPDDVDLLLVGPAGQNVLLMSDSGGGSALSNVTLTFDDAGGALPDETAIVSGTYRPTDYRINDTLPAPAPARPYGAALNAFNGTNPNGTWSLYVLDDEAGDLGQIAGWSLAITGAEPFADVAVAKADAPDPIATGSNLTYTVVITNEGPTTAENVTLADVLPGNVTYISASASQGSCLESGGTVNCTIGTLTAGQAVTVTLVVTPTALGSVTNSVTVASTTTDVNLANNSASSITTVLAPPVVTVQPADATVCPGATAMFSVTATGEPPLSYQWRKAGVDLTGETGPTLTINNVQAGNGGAYDVRVSNVVGSTLSDPATLTVLPPTSATSLVNIANICPGSTATFSTTASGTGPFSYVWRKDGAELTGETGNSLSFTATPTSGGTYCVEVTGMCNSVTNCATLTVAQAPTIATQPQNFNGVQGNSATFSVTASGTAPFTYQWRYNGVNLSNGGQVAGATTTTLTLASLNCTNEGSFDVIVSNCAGSVTSLAATLAVRPITAVYFDFETIGQFTNNLPNNGGADPLVPIPFEAAGAGVGAGRGLDLLNNNGTVNDSSFRAMPYDFSVNGRVLRASVMFKLKAGANNVNDTVMMLGLASKASRLDSGDEQVAFAGVKILGQGAVAAAPATGYQMQLRNKVFAGTAVGTSNATANATLVNGNWYKLSVNFTNIKATVNNAFRYNATLVDMGPNGTTAGATVLFTGNTNVINADLVNDTSVFFDIRMRENAGLDFIDELSINTADGPVFFACQPRSQTVVQGRPATINAYIDGTPPFAYQWLKDGVPIPGATDWQYKIPAASAADAGDYRLQVTAGGSPIVSDPATLTVASDATGPVLVSAGSFDGCTIGVCFDEPLDSVSATTAGNYSVGGASVGFVQLRPDRKSAILYISPGIGGAFTVTVNGVQDIYGNTITAGSMASGNVASHLSSLEIGGPLPSVTGNDAIYSCNDGDFDITAGGADVWGNSDQFRFTHQSRTGDFDVRVKVAGQTIPNTVLKAGLMVRENLDAASRTLHAIVNPPWPALDRYETGQRTAYAGTTVSWGVGVANGNRAATPPNSWVRMRRLNNTFTAYAGSNGVDWVAIAQTTQFYPPTVLVGLEMCSHVQGRLGMTEFRSFGDFAGYPGAVINITTHPANTNINAGQTASFTVAATVTGAPASELQYQWQRSDGIGGFTNIPSANAASASFTTPALFGPDSGAAFRCVVRVAGVAGAASNPAVVTVTDAVAPTLLAANVLAGSLRHIVLVFSEPVSAGTAEVAGNYDVATVGGTPFTVASAAFFGNANTIVLTTSSDLFADEYRVIINNVQDLGTPPNTIAVNTTRRFRQFAAPLQPVVIEMFEDIGNNGTVANLQGQAIYAQGQPTYISYSNIFGHNVSLSASLLPGTSGTAADQYGVRAYTHFIPPTNGNYKFWIRGDDGLQLWMNTNGANGARSAVFASSTNHPAVEVAANAIDNLSNTKYLNFDEFNTGFTVTPIAGSSIVTGMRFTTANDAADRDPMTFQLEGTTGNPQAGPWTVIVPETSTQLTNTLARLTVGPTVPFANATAYTSYRVLFPTVRTNATANSMQIAEVEFLDASGRDVTDSGVVLIAENAANVANYGIGSTPANSKTNIALIGGQRYFLEALLREGGGGDGFSVMWTDSSVTAAPANTTFIPASALAYPEGSAPATPVIAELYTGPVPGATFGGSDLASLGTVTNHAKWGTAPDVLVYQKYFAMQPQLVNTRFDNYGGRIYSYFIAPSNGLYRFYLRSDDSSQLYMNTNAVNSTDPAGMVLLGQLTAFTGPYTLVGQNVPLNGGQSYYIEARWKEGTGGDGIAMTFRAQSDTTPPPTVPIPELPSPDSFGLPNPPLLDVGAVGLTGVSPSSPVLSEGQTVTLSPVGLSGAQPYTFTWLKNGAFVADSIRYTTLPATPADNGAVYTLIVSNAFSRAQASATVTVNIDTTVPTIVSVSSHSYLTNVIVTFSEPIKQATALNAGNYQIAGLTVLNAYADASLRRVSLFTSPQTPGAPYVLNVTGLSDNSEANNPLAPASVPFNAWQATGCEVGSLQVELFTNMTGVAIANLTSDGRYINNLADSFSTIREFQWTSVPPSVGNGMENYGVRISGHFIAPSNGVYRFYIRSDDASQLFLNSNLVNSTDPAGKVLIAREDTCCKAYGDTTAGGPRVSAGIPLNAGQRYYIEGLLKEGGGGDFFQMAWREAGDPTTPPNNENASGQFFALPPNPVDTTPPQVVRTYSLSGNSVIIEFNEALDATADLSNPNIDPFNYYIDDGSGAVNANVVTVRGDGRSLLLDIPQIGAASYTIQIDNVRDQHCNTMPSTIVPGAVFALATGLRDNTDLGAHNTNPTLTVGTAPMVNPASPGSAAAVSPNNLTIIAGGTDMWDNADGMHYTYGMQTGDFDVRVRVESLVPRNNWSKAGLMLRENLTGSSRNLSAIVTPSSAALDGSGAGANDYEAGSRNAVAAATADWGQFRPTPVPYPNAWIRLRRSGDTFFAYAGTNGVNWVQFATTTTTYPATVLLGLGTTSHNNAFGQTTAAIYHDYGFIFPPTIVDQPDSLTVVSGETASFSVVAGGTPPFSYQWRFNGGNIANETNATLTINSVTVANAGNYDVVVSNMNSSVTSDVAVLTVLALDFGDAPAPYPTLLADNGARHVIVAGFHLGAATTDTEVNGQPSLLADGDDTTGTDDEDGVVNATPLIRGQTASVDVLASAPGKLDAWIDYNRDGDWADAGERVANNVPLAAGVNTLPVPIPTAAGDGPTYARLRFSSLGGLSYDGLAQDGEVEDYVVLLENTPPIARNDGFGAITNAPRSIAASALLANDTDANGDTLSVTGVSSSSMQGGTVTLVGATVTYTPPANFSGADFFTYTISDGHGGTATATVCITVNIANLAFAEPIGGWGYIYDGATDSYGVASAPVGNSALDGNWTHGNGSDSWAQETTLVADRPGAGNGLVGGVGSVSEADAASPGGLVTFLRMVDGITAGSTSTDNRRFYLMRDLSTVPGYTPTFMNSGITITFRSRLVPDAALEGALTPANKGGMVGADGKGMFGFRQASGDQIVTFSLHTATEDGAPTPAFSSAGLTLNKNVGDAPSAVVGNPSSAAVAQNDLALDPNPWHEFWITVRANDATPGNGTHTATVYMDGSQTPAGVFNFTAGNGDEGTSTTPLISDYLQLGQNFTPLTGAFDTDFYGVRMGAVAPGGFNDAVAIVAQPANTATGEGATASFNVGVTGTAPYFFQWFENGVPIPNATNSAYTRMTTCADDGQAFHVVVSNFCSQATSTSATLTVTSAVPALSITRQGSDVVIAWPVSCETFIVQESISLQPGNIWTTAGGTASTVGNEHRLTIPMSPTENRFYRLQRP